MNKVIAAWVAGMIEGEAHIRVRPTKYNTPSTVIAIASTDRDVCQKLLSVTGCGCMFGPYNQKKNGKIISKWKPFWVWQVADKKQILKVGNAVRPHLCERRGIAMDEVISVAERADEYAAMRKNYWADRTHCKNGHEYTTENTHMAANKNGSKHRVCRTCRAQRKRRWEDRHSRAA